MNNVFEKPGQLLLQGNSREPLPQLYQSEITSNEQASWGKGCF